MSVVIDKNRVRALIETFQRRLPGFDNFGDSSEDYNSAERDYKIEICALYDDLFRKAPRSLADRDSRIAFAKDLERLFTQPLKAASNKPQNLVGWRYVDAIRKLDESAKERLPELVQALVDEQHPVENRVDHFVRQLSDLVLSSTPDAPLGDAATRSLTTFFLFVAHPQSHLFIKTREINRFLQAVGQPPMQQGPLKGSEYRRVLDIAQALRAELEAEGWAPRDMIDVQSFVWVTMAHDADVRDDGERDAYRVRLTEGAIRYGYVSAGTRGEFFPDRYFGGDAESEAAEQFTLVVEGAGDTWTTDIRSSGNAGRIRARFGSLFQRLGIESGDWAVIHEVGADTYRMSFERIHEPAPELPATRAKPELNQILYGPPGTGKTYHTINRALAILDPDYLDKHDDRRDLQRRFDELRNEDRVRFVTFHQSFSYEDFVEGLRAHHDDDTQSIRYEVEPGVFRRLVEDATLSREGADSVGVVSSAQAWKISIDGTGPSERRRECFRRGQARIGWGHVGDLGNQRRPASQQEAFDAESATNQNTLMAFAEGIKVGDLLLCISSAKTVQAVGVVAGDYEFDDSEPELWGDYLHTRRVNWLATDLDLDLVNMNGGKSFTLKTVYPLTRMSPAEVMGLIKPAAAKAPPVESPYVLIIDEINRGNISRIFGELITLIEPSKRAGREEALSVHLPYSKKLFSVPDNVYIIGTMNTADRSLTGLDIALRRRFVFEEVAPDPEVLRHITVDGVNMATLLQVMNRRIEVLLNRDHCIGHSYFLPLERDPSLPALADIFRRQVLPLLQEYFFEDWERVSWVLNDHRKNDRTLQFVVRSEHDVEGLFGDDSVAPNVVHPWRVQESALERIESYMQIIRASPEVSQ